jgi:hypothetical protein
MMPAEQPNEKRPSEEIQGVGTRKRMNPILWAMGVIICLVIGYLAFSLESMDRHQAVLDIGHSLAREHMKAPLKAGSTLSYEELISIIGTDAFDERFRRYKPSVRITEADRTHITMSIRLSWGYSAEYWTREECR